MKKIVSILLIVAAVLGLAACGGSKEEKKPETVGEILFADFKEDAAGTPQEIVERILANEIIPFEGASMEVVPGLLMGFDNAEITGFDSGVMFAPMMGTIPFVGYVFELSDGTDVEEFEQTLKDNANLRWNICTEAEEVTVGAEENKVFFLMSPKSFEESAE